VIAEDNHMNIKLEKIKAAVIAGSHIEIKNLVNDALQSGESPVTIINDALIAALDIVGQDFSEGKAFVPEMLISARTMKAGLEVVRPLISAEEDKTPGTIVIATVKGDLHDIGKNLVSMMLEGAGFRVIDLGVDLKVEKLIEQVKAVKPEILGLSALLTTTMPEMQKVIDELKRAGLRDHVKVIVGGAPVDSKFAQKIGADGYGANATEAVDLARRFIAAKQ
jgi:5-methyltetrahydrofolate--homocysteine methyltransferase